MRKPRLTKLLQRTQKATPLKSDVGRQEIIMNNDRKLDCSLCLTILRTEYDFLKKRYNVDTMYLFGSVARKDNSQYSDVDIMVTFNQVPSILTFINMENYLINLLGYQVDLVMESSLKPEIYQRVFKERIQI